MVKVHINLGQALILTAGIAFGLWTLRTTSVLSKPHLPALVHFLLGVDYFTIGMSFVGPLLAFLATVKRGSARLLPGERCLLWLGLANLAIIASGEVNFTLLIHLLLLRYYLGWLVLSFATMLVFIKSWTLNDYSTTHILGVLLIAAQTIGSVAYRLCPIDTVLSMP